MVCVRGPFRGDGSSPLTRGKPSSCTLRPRTTRLIPAHAGKTAQIKPGKDLQRAHPRSRGENVDGGGTPREHTGSSPLTRGKRTVMFTGTVTDRLIPAHAGKTHPIPTGDIDRAAHPRSRGENDLAEGAGCEVSGSSPLTRGKPNVCNADCQGRRLIPAHAGKTITVAVSLWGILAHPRSRGENDLVTRFFQGRPGSSPLTRGKHTSRPALLLRRSIRSWKPLSLPSPLEVTQFGSLAQLTRRRIRFGVLASSFRVVGAHHECESIEVNGLPWVSPRQEGESLLVARPVDHDGTSGLHVLSDDVPQALAYTGAERPHEDPRGNLHEPPRHVTSQPLGHRGQDQDDHQESLSS